METKTPPFSKVYKFLIKYNYCWFNNNLLFNLFNNLLTVIYYLILIKQ